MIRGEGADLDILSPYTLFKYIQMRLERKGRFLCFFGECEL